MKYIFGPVPSRRLGLSLGIDLLPFKTCSLDCIYCECGKTTDLRVTEADFYPVSEVIAELSEVLSNNPKLDHVTFSGSGEPLLYKSIDQIISYLKNNHPQYRIVLLTNSIGLLNKENWQKIKDIDVIIPSIDSVINSEFEKINRPHPDIDLDDLLESMLHFRRNFKGEFRVEYFIVPGINDNDRSVQKMKEYLSKLKPDLIQLNRLDRPGTEADVQRADDRKMLWVSEQLLPLQVEPVGNFIGKNSPLFDKDFKNTVKDLLLVRPVELYDLIKITGRSRLDIRSVLNDLSEELDLKEYQKEGKTYYRLGS